MQKLGTGYTNYFHKKYGRVGSLFQGRFKAVLLDRESHLIHLPYYIHTNPLDLNYRSSTSIEFLEGYRWSSFLDYIGKRNFPSVTERGFILNMFGGHQKYREFTVDRLQQSDSKHLLNEVMDVIIEDLDIITPFHVKHGVSISKADIVPTYRAVIRPAFAAECLVPGV